MNIEKIVSNEITDIQNCISAAITQYNDEKSIVNKTPNVIPPDYHVLFILVRKIRINGVVYSVEVNSTNENIFREAVENFKYSVEEFSKHNVHIIPTIKVIEDEVQPSDSNRRYLIFQDIHDYLKSYSTAGLYDAVIVATSECTLGGAVTTIGMFQYEVVMHGFTHIEICSSDSTRAGNGYPMEYPHLITTNYFIHEWMHQLETYRNNIAAVYPDTHGYLNPSSLGYDWDKHYFDDTTQYEHIVEHSDDDDKKTSFYRAVLAGEIKYTSGGNTLYIGMFPLFWKVTPRKTLIGRYFVQNMSNQYYYNDNGAYDVSSNLTNEIKYVWNVFYSFLSNNNRIFSFDPCDAEIPYSMISSLKFTRVGPYDEGEYCLVNVTLNDSVLGYTSSNTLNTVAYRSNSMQTFMLNNYSELYFSLAATELSEKYLNLTNNYDIEDNTVSLYGWTGYPTAQTWQYRFNGNNYKIMPKQSPTRSLSFHDSGLHITSTSNIQNWRPELISNGKYVIPGTYKIKTASNYYLSHSGNTLKLSTTGETWTLTPTNDNYYNITVSSGGTTYYFDVLNGYDIEGNTVQIQYGTGFIDAQSWKLMLRNDGSVIIVPRVSLSRGIKSTTTGSTLSTSPTAFYLEKV